MPGQTALVGSGALHIADCGNRAERKVLPDGTIMTAPDTDCPSGTSPVGEWLRTIIPRNAPPGTANPCVVPTFQGVRDFSFIVATTRDR